MKGILIKTKSFLKKLREDHISESAAECAYYTILSFVPFIIFFLTLIQFTVFDKQIIIDGLKNIVPTSMYSFVFNIIDEVYLKSVKTVSGSLIFALWSASKGFYALCKGVKNIYKLSEDKSNFIVRLEGLAFTLLFMISLLIVMILIVFGNRIHYFITENFFPLGIISYFFLKIRTFITILTMFFVFLFLYKFVPKHKMNFKSQIPGAIFSSVSWIMMSFVFSIYINIFKGFSNTYGSLTSIILIMMWIYVCMYIILLGAEINIFVRDYKLKIIEKADENRKIQ